MRHPNKKIMEYVIQLARQSKEKGAHAIAAVIVKDNKIIAEEYTTVDIDIDPTYHAEMKAIWSACKILKTRDLSDCYLYTTDEPCPMCASAAIWGRLKGIVFAARMEDGEERCRQRVRIKAKDIIKQGTPKLEIHSNFMRGECLKTLREGE